MIIGHTVQNYGEIHSRCNGKLILIDIGLSYCYGSYFGYVEIKNDVNEVWAVYKNWWQKKNKENNKERK